MKKNVPVIFDLDGTLFRSESVEITAFGRAFEANGLKNMPKDEILSFMGLKMQEVCLLLGLTDRASQRKFRNDLVTYEKEAIYTSGELYKDAAEMLKHLREDGFRLCICSNGESDYIYAVTERFELTGLFEVIRTADDGYSKSEALGHLVKRLGADRFIMVGDRTSDIEAARENGGISIGAAYGYGGSEAAAADYTAESIQEVERLISLICNKET